MRRLLSRIFRAQPANGAPRFTWWRGDDGQFRFHFQGGNNRIVCPSEGYTSKSAMMDSIWLVKDQAFDAPIVERK
jgi:uncharacterized protein YegP (UPF0339 family)